MRDQLRQLPRPLYYLFAGTTITRMGSFVFPYLTIYLSEARGYAVDRIGQILSVGSIGLLLGNFAGGWLTDRWSRKWTLVAALLLNAVGFAALSAGYETPVLYALALFIGYFGSGARSATVVFAAGVYMPEPKYPISSASAYSTGVSYPTDSAANPAALSSKAETKVHFRLHRSASHPPAKFPRSSPMLPTDRICPMRSTP